MKTASFVGDDWNCECGNTPNSSGFYPCLRTGRYVDCFEEEMLDGNLYRCAGCDAIIEWDDATDTGKIVGRTEAQFVGMEAP